MITPRTNERLTRSEVRTPEAVSDAPSEMRGRGRSHHGRHFWMPPWMLRCSVLSGVCALVWLLLRSGTKPSRITYPCQQAAFGTAALVFGAPVVAAVFHLRERVVSVMRTRLGQWGLCTIVAAVGVTTIASVSWRAQITLVDPPADYRPTVYFVKAARGIEPGRFGGVDDLVKLMGLRGFKWHRCETTSLTSGPDGMIDADDVVILKINAQWPERGGTNTDVLRGVIRIIIEHPDGFTGEIVVADNTQNRGTLDWAEGNAEDDAQSAADVVADFADGWNVTTRLWDDFRGVGVAEYDQGDERDGYVVNPVLDPESRFYVSYPKFKSAGGHYISYKHGVWSPPVPPVPGTYDPDKLVVINIPVLKTHMWYGITAAVKNHMGVVTQSQGTGSHFAVARGGMGSVMAEVRAPDLNILDCIWVLARPGAGPEAPDEEASRRDQLVASTDPAAMDTWAAKNILVPQFLANGYSEADYFSGQDPDNPDSDFRSYIDLSMNEMLLGGIDTNSDYATVDLKVWQGDADRDGDVDLDDYADFVETCVTGPGGGIPPGCDLWDLDEDDDIDLGDFGSLQTSFTGAF